MQINFSDLTLNDIEKIYNKFANNLDTNKTCDTCRYKLLNIDNYPCSKCFNQILNLPLNPSNWEPMEQ